MASCFDEELLAALKAEGSIAFSERNLEKIWRSLEKVPLAKSIDHGALQQFFNLLQSWLGEDLLAKLIKKQLFPMLVKIYENLLLRDFGKSEVLKSILQLLFFLEDISDYEEGKTEGGIYFVPRLLALAESRIASVKLHRAAVETLCAFVTRSSQNQQILLEETKERNKLFKDFLQNCGDFWLQASILEILFRLSRRKPELLDVLGPKIVSAKMHSLLQMKNPDLLLEIRSIVNLLNESMGNSRSVYSLAAEDIAVDGQSAASFHEEKWVHFGLDHLSFYGMIKLAPLSQETFNTGDAQLIDVCYHHVTEILEPSKTSLEILVPCLRESINTSKGYQMLPKQSKVQFTFKPKDLSALTLHVLPRLVWRGNHQLKIKPNEGNSQNTSTPSGLSSKSVSGFRKASIGYSIPLPKRVRSAMQVAEESNHPTRIREKKLQAYNGQAIQEKLHCQGQRKTVNDSIAQQELQSPETCWEQIFSLKSIQPKSMPPDKENKLKINDSWEAVQENKKQPIGVFNGDHAYNPRTPVQEVPTAEVSLEKTLSGQQNYRKDSATETSVHFIEKQPGGSITPEVTPFPMQLEKDQESNKENEDLTAVTIIDDTASGRSRQKDLQIAKLMTPTIASQNNEGLLNPEHCKDPSPLKDDKEEDKHQQHKPAVALKENRDVNIYIKEQKAKASASKKQETDTREVGETVRTPMTDPDEQLRKKIREILKQASSPSASDPFQPKKQTTLISDPIETDSEYHHVPEHSKWNDKNVKKTSSKHCKRGTKQATSVKGHPISVNRPERKRKVLREIGDIHTDNFINKPAIITPVAALKETPPFQTMGLTSTPVYNAFYAKRHRGERRVQAQSLQIVSCPQEFFTKILFAETVNDQNDSPFIHKLELDKEISDKEPLLEKSPKDISENEEDTDIDYNISFPAAVHGCKAMFSKEHIFRPKDIFSTLEKNGTNWNLPKTPDIQWKDPPEDVDAHTLHGNDENCNLNEALALLANLLQRFKRKVNVEAKLKISQILTGTSEAIQQRLQDVEMQIKRDMDNHMKLSKTKLGQLQIQLKDEHEKLTSMHERYKEELTNHQRLFSEITSQVETTKRELRNLVDKQKTAHKKLLGKTWELTENHLAEAEKKLLAVQKTARTMQGLRDTIKEMLQEIR